MIDLLMWLVVAMAFLGTILNIYKKPICFKIWAVTNALNAGYAYWIGSNQQGTLFVAYFLLAIWGIIKWKQSKPSGEAEIPEGK